MQICRELAGFSYGQADNVRRAMSKKKHAVMEQERAHFVYGNDTPGQECKGCVANGIPAEVANDIYDDMSSFASYAFNKSHAACYAYVAYQTAYLKCHYPVAFMAALLTSVLDNTDKVIEYSSECSRLGIKLLPPDVNVSYGGFTADGKNIRFGLDAVKNVGRNLVARTIEERKGEPFRDLYDYCKRMRGNEINRRAVENLIRAGAFDTMGATRRSMLESVEGILKSVENDARKNVEGQLDFFAAMGEESEAAGYEMPKLEEFTSVELLQMEKDATGLYLSGHPLDSYRKQIANFASHTIKDLVGEDAKAMDEQRVIVVCTVVKSKFMTTKSNSMMAFTNIEDLTGSMEIIVFPKVLEQCRDALTDNAVVVVSGRVSVREDEPAKLLADQIVSINEYDPRRPQSGSPSLAQKTKQAEKRLYIRVPTKECLETQKVLNLLEIFDGDKPVVLFLADTRQKLAVPRRLWAKDHPLLRQELERILGEGSVVEK